MRIYQVADKKHYLPLLLLADEQNSMVDRYLDKSEMFVLDEDGVKGEIVVFERPTLCEIKKSCSRSRISNRGYGRKLIEFVYDKFKNKYPYILVGTGDGGLAVPFYEKCGFFKCFTVKNFFTDNYDHPIFENGKQLTDMVYLTKELR